MKFNYLSGLLFLIFLTGTVVAQDSTHINSKKETKEQRKQRNYKAEHPNALTPEQRAQIKKAEEDADYQRKNINFAPNLTHAQRRAKILETKKEFMVKVKTILTPEQLANIEVKKPKESNVLAVRGPSGPIKYEIREKTIIRTVDVASDSVRLDFYDNGDIDGDSITVFFNNKIIVQHLMLLGTPASFMVKVDHSIPNNEIIMYAENLGTEPPNTALMVVTDGDKKYEINVVSDLKKSGTIYLHPIAAR